MKIVRGTGNLNRSKEHDIIETVVSYPLLHLCSFELHISKENKDLSDL